MGRKIDLVSFLCGAITGKKTPPHSQSKTPKTEYLDSSPVKESSAGWDSPEEQRPSTAKPPLSDQEEVQNLQPIPPPPGRQHHMRAASCHHHHSRSNSSLSKLTSSLSMKVLTASRREDSGNNKKMMKHEDSIWKKTIILGEKCRVTDEDEDTILYDENGNRISAYHPKKNAASVLSLSRQTSRADQDSVPPRLGARN
ncbi:uncharacterized protein [Primulina eburnea]|uniref:uncharacterized protein n=1 Tax=Primulina eburnea TaxID=1245227 RepID=UPI003C6C044D